ncbi:MAG: hypothetical protein AUJ92_01805 [Armatimonadetes bacterium CG2_30_59_28]|nr:glutamine synthetase [Armatimonadota bacterium]OIO98241.1 MAG: hypothetical protein AUJ92_01805 [Armatimonadetes bacterium CG2_30_59_28]PIU65633.1 MAG: hypothetical protein COS85_08005 [Armatimonadetes bacterium CG07_land_8_20_14_0_80_59_28]PIX44074.1 MAG: hypothetical protein COZ56_05590 [Armatimonadetes bacterium CG_4_8_14_3_um_filter_58_9]PIY39305.1 MAG: hypothetical protein COZ05_19405 [Armatimonadetes bacterium CG_4_10_14_3_um_filter_59_10]PJB70703.1 MAG: hypothetical protein CO095_087
MDAESLKQVADFFAAHGVKVVKVIWCDLHGLARGKVISTKKFFDELHQGITFSIAPLYMNLLGEVVDLHGDASRTGWTSCFASPDMSTLRLCALDPDTAEVICHLKDRARVVIPHLPRVVLARMLAFCAEMGFRACIGSELEFYLLDGEADTTLPPGKNCYRLIHGRQEQSFLSAVQAKLSATGINYEASMSEDGPGQFEIVLYQTPAMKHADDVFRTRSLVKSIAAGQGLTATFLSKPVTGESGSGYHIHQTLSAEADGRSIFDASQFGEEAHRRIRNYVGGQLAHLPDVCALLLPTVNAYKRILTRGARPLSLTWGEDNRTVALRVIGRNTENARVENRVIAGEANPYIAIAASLAAGLQGIRDDLTPPAPTEGNAFENSIEGAALPADLGEALERLGKSDFAEHWLGRELVTHFVALKMDEWERYRRAITDWEKREYLAFL